MTNNFDFDDIRPRTWSDAFPWLAGAAGVSDSPWWEQVIGDTDFTSRQHYLAQISELAMERLTHWTVGQIFPGLSPELDLSATDLPKRAHNALVRLGFSSSGQLMTIALEDMLAWRQVGVGTVDAILQRLADASTSNGTPPIAHQDFTPPAGSTLSFDTVRMPDWMAALVEDLNTVATWYGTIGLPSQPLIGAPIPGGTPSEVVKARQRIETL